MIFPKKTFKRFLSSSSLDSNYIAKLSDSDNLLLQFSAKIREIFLYNNLLFSLQIIVSSVVLWYSLLLRHNIIFGHLGS